MNKFIILLFSLVSLHTYAQKKKNYSEKVDEVTFDMIYVKGGEFQMGDRKGDLVLDTGENPSLPLHNVKISGFFVGKFEVTQNLWETVMGKNPSETKMGNLPVETVSWNDCQDFIKKLNTLTGKDYRLLTEAEWEYVARGGKKHSDEETGNVNITDRAWILDNSEGKLNAVGSKQPNELGIYDLQGNVWEWVNDWYAVDSYKKSMSDDPQGVQNGKEKVYRGGSYMSEEEFCRPAYRNYDEPQIKQSFIGLRLARSL
ncbi:SUMF1/EgtB/PvdO family nonheme iron enzyme [Flammeovirga yaeyamensis]|uniref:SUMF1/EgtB/PvdO family nonheme iron enzyme n=1 Tax=Flammeovirga yaeyamensis TaxID=367791 RepID=A0AAX1N0E4_9BACT|nr:formylglycine-generating enzyme family protein [Flammeovirga yaeyamensis]MBB3700099.1 formylglycine-generating enzyme required for sulfatase activity [Flammeovirga yaeyamensis]NMF37270.1 formylglycine-generating enzyme family protein [Flammeovirga yaeyamensis]QWG00957.1 SUMF1/EgtB/PvdO family nonheme iron enzyme [Flammeovirga yaeyamensis]